MRLLTRYKNNFKKQALWIWGDGFVYSHPNSQHLELSLGFPLFPTALVAVQASLQRGSSLPATQKGRHGSPAQSWWLVPSTGAAPGSTVSRGVTMLGRMMRQAIKISEEIGCPTRVCSNGPCQCVPLVSSPYRRCFVHFPMYKWTP